MENMRYYFNQFWSLNNPDILRAGELTDALERVYKKIWDETPPMETRIGVIAKKYEYYLLGKKAYKTRQRERAPHKITN